MLGKKSQFKDGESEVRHIPVDRIRPEDGLGRKRNRANHRDLQKSIEQFGVLTPITVRRAPNRRGHYLLIKGQGRTLACRLLGLTTIPAIVVDDAFAENIKVQQFLVENVARLKMRSVDRALLIARGRRPGEETADVAKRFGVSATTVRRLEAQLEGASNNEVAALRAGRIKMALHAVIARHVDEGERSDVVEVVADHGLSTRDLEALFIALGWRRLVDLGPGQRHQRLLLLAWACNQLSEMKPAGTKERMRELALTFPLRFETDGSLKMGAKS